MNETFSERIDALGTRVPPMSQSFVDAVMRRVAPRRRLWRRSLGAVAAAVTVGTVAGYLSLASSARPAFADVLAHVEQIDAVRFWQTYASDSVDPSTKRVARLVTARGGRIRREWGDPIGNATYRVDQHGHKTRMLAPGEVVGPHEYVTIRNEMASPGDELWIEPAARTVEISPTDEGRAALAGDDPLVQLRRIGLDGVKPAPDEVVDGRPMHVFTSAAVDKQQTRRVLVDARTDLPVLIESKYGHSTLVLDHFEWNPPIDAMTFDAKPPAGYAVSFDAMRAFSHGLIAYSSEVGRLPNLIDAAALAKFDAAAPTSRPAGFTKLADRLEVTWGFSVPAFARRHGLDLVYAGAGKRIVLNLLPSTFIAAIQTTPGGVYDVLRSDFSHDTLRRDQLPTTRP